MELVSCQRCKALVNKAVLNKCQSCGHPLKGPKRAIMKKIIKLKLIIFNLIMVYWLFTGGVMFITHHAYRIGLPLIAGVAMFTLGIIWVIGLLLLGLLLYIVS